MTAPLNYYLGFGDYSSLLFAAAIGIAFGFILERAGLADPRKLTAIFYLDDFLVYKVMFTAIIVAASGLWALTAAGLLDMQAVIVVPTYLWPQLVGGFIFGIGFVVGGYCPGTSVVGISSGRFDALVFFLGMMFGMWFFAEIFTSIAGFFVSGKMDGMTLYSYLGIAAGVVTLAIAVLAIISFPIVEKIEKRSR